MEGLIKSLPKLLRAAGESDEVAEVAAQVAWRRVAGESLRGCAVPFRLYRKTLIVAVPDATWQKQMGGLSSQLLFRPNSLLGQAVVTYIEFRIDPKTVNAERARMKKSVVNDQAREERALECADSLRSAAAGIRDEALRRRFLVAAGSYIDAQEHRK